MLSKLFHDQPMKPLDKAIYWIEYVIRHKGAHHLKTAENQLTWIASTSIDVIFLFLLLILVTFFIIFYILKSFHNIYLRHKKTTDSNDINDKKDK